MMAEEKKSSSSSSSSISNISSKVCLFVSCSPADDEDLDGCHFYIFDLNSKFSSLSSSSFIPSSPVLRLKTNRDMAPCVLYSTLYLFEGRDGHSTDPEAKLVLTYDLSSPLPDVIQSRDNLPRTTPMIGVKNFPAAVASPDRRNILIFSTRIIVGCPSEPKPDCFLDFELFDPRTKTYQELPSPFAQTRTDLNTPMTIEIKSYAFINESTFFIQTGRSERMNAYTLDLTRRIWVKIDSPDDQSLGRFVDVGRRRMEPALREGFFVVGGCLALNHNARAAYDILQGCPVFDIPDSAEAREEMPFPPWFSRRMTLLDRDSTLCVLNSNFDEDVFNGDITEGITVHPHVYIDVYKFDVDNIADGKHKFSLPPAVSFKFVLNALRYVSFSPLYLFPIHEE